MKAIWDDNGKVDFDYLAEQFGTPFYLYDAELIKRRIRKIKDQFHNLVDVYYAVKSNPNLELLRIVRDSADGLDISSGGELQQALKAGYDPGAISFAGPAKTNDELTKSIQQGVGCISIESLRELESCRQIAKQLKTRAGILLRVNPKFLNRTFSMKMGGRPIQFGIDEEHLDEAVAKIQSSIDFIDFRGIHVYAGSQCFDPEGILDGVNHTIRIVEKIETASKINCGLLNLGGGFGVSHTKRNTELDVIGLGRLLSPVLREFRNRSVYERKFVFELGRFLTAPAGIYVTRVISKKRSRDKTFFMVDGGLHHHLTASGTFGAALRSNFILRNVSQTSADETKCNIAGPSCNPTDLLGVNVELPSPEIGDLIGVESAGSYGLTASPILFLGRPTPAELVYDGREFRLGRASKTILDFN